MRHNTKVTNRNSSEVVSIHLEILAHLNKRLEKACEEYQKSKREIIETALFVWLNQMDGDSKEQEK